MSNQTLNLTPQLYQYLLSTSLREPAVMKHLRLETAKLPSHNCQIAPEQGQFMALLIELLGARKVLELGTYTGYSALAMALALPPQGKLITCDINDEWTAMAQQFWREAGVAHKIELRLGPALETLEKLLKAGEADTFDFAFIDADKANYSAYYEKIFQLVRRGGLIAVDNVLWDGAVADPAISDTQTKAIRALNEKLKNDERISFSLVPIADGLALARKR
ncbi:MAG: class I SAM-dependent methyltransferase [Proteobacteria bacterium]|nr:class I SAM-dependent methyltransferase [Pseudomonadota bacterium]